MEQAGVVVTLDQIYAELQGVHSEVRDMRAEVRSISDHERRLRLLERKIWFAAGASAVVTGGLVQVVNAMVGV